MCHTLTQSVPVCIALKLVPGLNASLELRVLISELLSVVDHTLNVLGSQSK